jgi:hypothetical protein
MNHRAGSAKTEPERITVRVPLVFRKRGGRKTVTAPDTPRAFVAQDHNGHGALVRAIARAFRWRTVIETGAHATIADLAAAEEVNPSYASRVLRLALLAPDIVDLILDRRRPTGITLDRLMRPFPVAWEQQRSIFRSE